MKSINISISPKSILMVFAIVGLIWLLSQAKDVILLVFASFVIASALLPAVDAMSKKIPRWLAVTLVFLIGLVILATIFIPFFAVLVKQANGLMNSLPNYWVSAEQYILKFRISLQGYAFLPNTEQIMASMAQFGENLVSQSINITINFFTGIIAVFTLSTIVLFLLLDKNSLKKGLLKFFPVEKREKVECIFSNISKRVGGYVRGQLLVMLAVGVLTAIVLTMLKIPYASLLGLVAGLFEIIPIIGPILSAVPAVIIALAINPILALVVIIAYLVIQRLESSLISPFILGKFLDMPPLVIVVVLLLAAMILGVAGVILSPAIAAAGYVLVQELYLNRINPPTA